MTVFSHLNLGITSMRVLESQEMNAVTGTGYWLDTCTIFGCYSTYVYEERWIPGFWLPEEWIDVCGNGYCTTSYFPAEWVPGYWDVY